MLRDLLWAGLFFAAGYAVAKNAESLRQDIARYNRLRAMSGEPPLIQEQLQRLSGAAQFVSQSLDGGSLLKFLKPLAGMLPGVGSDIERYAKISSM
jgi:hypothetical protein